MPRRFEYRKARFQDERGQDTATPLVETALRELNRLGAEGWRVVRGQGGFWLLEREIEGD